MRLGYRAQLKQGFTIVELLIVIVVIAILAAITVVAYGGVQRRAQNAVTAGSVKQVVTALESYYAANGAYPLADAAGEYGSAACLGEGYPGDNCATISGCVQAGEVKASSYLNEQIHQFLQSSLPAVRFPPMMMKAAGCDYEIRGIMYTTGCALYEAGVPEMFDPVHVGFVYPVGCTNGRAYMITYAVSGTDATACGLASADDLTELYKYIYNDPNVVPAGWRVCSAYGGKEETM